MCGIAGIISLNGKQPIELENRLSSMQLMIRHRGPDGSGWHIGHTFGALNVRLAIVDREGGQQPIYTPDKRMGIVFNGEIYNFKELREDLEAAGMIFSTETDTEVVLRLFEQYGETAFARLHGMFACCIWDDQNNIYIARDHLGIKPLYYYRDDSTLIFSSELKAIIGLEGLDLTLSEEGINDYFTFRYHLEPHTLYRKIYKLPAANFIRIQGNSVVRFPFWELSYEDPYHKSETYHELQEMLESKLQGAVKSQLMGEVPIGVLLSGGLDSSIVAAELHQLGVQLKTFNIGFPQVNEFEFSRAVSKAFDLEHIELVITPNDLLQEFDRVLYSLDEPIADPACFPLYVLARELKKHVTVVLSGEGGDELFGGYPQYVRLLSSDPFTAFDDFISNSHYFLNGSEFLKRKDLVPPAQRLYKYFAGQDPLHGALNVDMRSWMPENLMMKADKIAMAHSLEGRFPFLDIDLVEFAARLPSNLLIRDGTDTKFLLRQLGRQRLPSIINERPKMGFTVPVADLLVTLKDVVMDSLHQLENTDLGLFLEGKKLEQLAIRYYRGDGGNPLQLWTYFIFCYWYRFTVPQYQTASRASPSGTEEIQRVLAQGSRIASNSWN